MDLEYMGGFSPGPGFRGTKRYRCNKCDQKFTVEDDGKTRNEAFLQGGKTEPTTE